MERDFEVGGRKFKLGKIDALRQFHIVRRIGPLITDLMPQLAKVAKPKTELSEEEKFSEMAQAFQPFMEGLAKLSDNDADYVLFRLLGCVEVHQPEFSSWAKIATDNGIMMQDIELPILLQAAGRAFFYNMQGFLALLPRT